MGVLPGHTTPCFSIIPGARVESFNHLSKLRVPEERISENSSCGPAFPWLRFDGFTTNLPLWMLRIQTDYLLIIPTVINTLSHPDGRDALGALFLEN
jgi:hypothetical protein